MMFDSWQAFVAMGGHGLYVWLAYLAAFALLAANVAKIKMDRRRTLRLLRSQMEVSGHASQAP